MSRRCAKCDREPSGLIPRKHDFCEFCGERLPEVEPERVTAACYRCGKKFESVGGVTVCAECQALPVIEAPAQPDAPEHNFLSAALSGALFPIVLRVTYAMGRGKSSSPEARALEGLMALFFACIVLVALGLILGLLIGMKYKKPSAAEQWVTAVTMVATIALLWLLT